MSEGQHTRTPAQVTALAMARLKRAVAAERKTPEGYRSLEHFLDCVRDRVGRREDGVIDLAAYLAVNARSVRKWINREKLPLQPTIDAMALWLSIRR